MWLVVVHFACSSKSSIPDYCIVSTFHCPSKFDLKTVMFQQRIACRNTVKVFFPLMWNPNKVSNIIKLMQMIFSAWFGYWVCQLSPMWYNVYCSQLMPQSDCYQLQPDCEALSSKKCPARNFTNYFWHVCWVTAHCPLITQAFFCVSVVFLPFLK